MATVLVSLVTPPYRAARSWLMVICGGSDCIVSAGERANSRSLCSLLEIVFWVVFLSGSGAPSIAASASQGTTKLVCGNAVVIIEPPSTIIIKGTGTNETYFDGM